MSSLSQALYGDVSYPIPPSYNPANYQGVLGSPQYAANQAQAGNVGSSEAAATNHLAGGGNVQGGFTGGMANMMAQGSEQPQSEQDKLAQWNLQNQLAQGEFGIKNAQNIGLQQSLGNIAGTALGASLGSYYGGQNQNPVVYPNGQKNPYGAYQLNPAYSGGSSSGPLAGW